MTHNAHRNARRTAAAAAKSRSSLYELEADAIKALAHPKRLMVLDLLSDGGERSVTELIDATGVSQSNMSQNLAVLRAAGLVTTRKEGNVIWYRLPDPRITKAVGMVRAVLEAQVEDRQFLMEREALKRKERVRRAATYGVALLMGVSVLAFALGAVHPVLAGGTANEIPPHAALMLSSPDIVGMAQACASGELLEPSAPARGLLA